MDSEDKHPWRQLTLMLVMVGVAAWSEMPDWQRDLVRARVRTGARRVVGWMARRTGHRAMTDELDGRPGEAQAGYGFAYRLSVLRDKL